MNRQMQSPAEGFLGTLLLMGGAAMLMSFGVVLFNLVQLGHAAFGTSSDGVVWGLPVATYIYFALASTGLMFVASLAMVFGIRDYYPIAKRCTWLALVTLVAGFTALAFELGHPFRLLWTLPLSFQVRSPLNWMGVFYAACVVLLVLKLRLLARDDWGSATSRRLATASLVMEILAAGTLGLAFSMIGARPVWFGSAVPLYFLLTAFTTGVALAVLATHAAYGLDRDRMPAPVKSLLGGAVPTLFATAVGITLLAIAARVVSGVWSNLDGMQVFDRMVASPWFHVEVWAGLALPLVLLLGPGTRKSPGAQVAASVLVLVALFIGRYEFVVDGQAVPVFKGTWMDEFASYTPSGTEVMITLLAASMVVTLYAFGEKYLRLDAAPASDEDVAVRAAGALAHAMHDDSDLHARRPLAGSAAD